MCLQMVPAAFIGPMLLAVIQTGSGSYAPAFWAFLSIALATFMLSFAIRRPKLCPVVEELDECPADMVLDAQLA